MTARNPGPIRSGGIGRKPCRRNQGPFQAGSRNVVKVIAAAFRRAAHADAVEQRRADPPPRCAGFDGDIVEEEQAVEEAHGGKADDLPARVVDRDLHPARREPGLREGR